jgi:acetyl-CoA acetyltransferase
MMRVAVAGWYVSETGRRLTHRTPLDLMVEVVEGALAHAGVEREEVDGAALLWPGPGGSSRYPSANWARALPNLAWTSDFRLDTCGVRGLLQAAAAIEAGLCNVVVLAEASVAMFEHGGAAVGTDFDLRYADPYGSTVFGQYALVAARHMHDYGTTPEQLALVAATIRNNGRDNPEAVFFGAPELTGDDVLASPLIATPFHRLDCCVLADGAAAFVLMRADRAKGRTGRARVVELLGGGAEWLQQGSYANAPVFRDVYDIGRRAAVRSFAKAGVGPGDVDVLSLYDNFSFEVIRQLEVLGYCGVGEGGPFVSTGAIGPAGSLPVNLDGGLLAHGWFTRVQMTTRVIEAARQLDGSAVHQLDNADVAVVTNTGSASQHFELAVLGAT